MNAQRRSVRPSQTTNGDGFRYRGKKRSLCRGILDYPSHMSSIRAPDQRSRSRSISPHFNLSKEARANLRVGLRFFCCRLVFFGLCSRKRSARGSLRSLRSRPKQYSCELRRAAATKRHMIGAAGIGRGAHPEELALVVTIFVTGRESKKLLRSLSPSAAICSLPRETSLPWRPGGP
jgi:hypothetical protein